MQSSCSSLSDTASCFLLQARKTDLDYSWIGFLGFHGGRKWKVVFQFLHWQHKLIQTKTLRSMLQYQRKCSQSLVLCHGFTTHLCNLKSSALPPSSQHPVLGRNRDEVLIQTMPYIYVFLFIFLLLIPDIYLCVHYLLPKHLKGNSFFQVGT